VTRALAPEPARTAGAPSKAHVSPGRSALAAQTAPARIPTETYTAGEPKNGAIGSGASPA